MLGPARRPPRGFPPPRPPELPADLFLLEDLVKSKRAALVVIDPLMAFLSGQVDSHRDQDVRRVLASLAYMASRTGAAMVIVRHINKGTGSALYRGSGSIGIVGGARPGPGCWSRRTPTTRAAASWPYHVEPGQDAQRARLPDRRGRAVRRRPGGLGREQYPHRERPGASQGRRGRGARPGRGDAGPQGDPGRWADGGREPQAAGGDGWRGRTHAGPGPPGPRRDHPPTGIRPGPSMCGPCPPTRSRATRICSSTTPTTPGGSGDDRWCCPVRRLRQLVPGRRGDRLP
jgi:hypothetical protein